MGMKYRDPETGQFKDLKVKTSDTLPIGTQVAYGGSVPPSGWLICDGSAVSRTVYADLFAVIGTSYGAGDGSTTFNLPNKKGRVSAGYDSSTPAYNSIGNHVGGNDHFHLLPIGSLQNQDNVTIVDNNGNYEDTTISAGYARKSDAIYSSITASTNIRKSYSDSASSIQPTEVDNWIIKAYQSIAVVGRVVNEQSSSTTDTYSSDYINKLTNKIANEAYLLGFTNKNKLIVNTSNGYGVMFIIGSNYCSIIQATGPNGAPNIVDVSGTHPFTVTSNNNILTITGINIWDHHIFVGSSTILEVSF